MREQPNKTKMQALQYSRSPPHVSIPSTSLHSACLLAALSCCSQELPRVLLRPVFKRRCACKADASACEQSHGPSLLQGHIPSGMVEQVNLQSSSVAPDPAETADALQAAPAVVAVLVVVIVVEVTVCSLQNGEGQSARSAHHAKNLSTLHQLGSHISMGAQASDPMEAELVPAGIAVLVLGSNVGTAVDVGVVSSPHQIAPSVCRHMSFRIGEHVPSTQAHGL